MKLLHTGDLHLGKSLHETSLLDDQKAMLDRLADELARDDYAALVIAGDVYDRTVPPSAAVALFSDFLVDVRNRFPDLSVCVIPGNHDSAQRLAFADRILGTRHIHIISHPEDSFEPIFIERNGERIAVFLLPFLAAGSLSSGGDDLLVSQADLAREAAKRLDAALDRSDLANVPSVLVAHLFAASGSASSSERIFLGEAERVNVGLFSRFSYVALGHLHRCQKITERARYAGAPLAYSFDEAGGAKYFLKVAVDCSAPPFPVTVTPVPVVPKRNVCSVSGAFEDFYARTTHDSHAADYLEIRLTDDALVANPVNLLRGKFPYLLSVRQGADVASGVVQADGETANAARSGSEDRMDPVGDFRRFEEMLYGTADEDRVALFSSLLSECADEA